MDGAFDLTSVWCRATLRVGVIRAVHLQNHPIFIFYDINTADYVPVTQAHFLTRDEPTEPLRRVLLEVVAFD